MQFYCCRNGFVHTHSSRCSYFAGPRAGKWFKCSGCGKSLPIIIFKRRLKNSFLSQTRWRFQSNKTEIIAQAQLLHRWYDKWFTIISKGSQKSLSFDWYWKAVPNFDILQHISYIWQMNESDEWKYHVIRIAARLPQRTFLTKTFHFLPFSSAIQ